MGSGGQTPPSKGTSVQWQGWVQKPVICRESASSTGEIYVTLDLFGIFEEQEERFLTSQGTERTKELGGSKADP